LVWKFWTISWSSRHGIALLHKRRKIRLFIPSCSDFLNLKIGWQEPWIIFFLVYTSASFKSHVFESFSTGAQTVWNFDFCWFSDPHYFQISSGVIFMLLFDQTSSRCTYGVKCSKLEVLRQIKIGLHIFSHLQKNYSCYHIFIPKSVLLAEFWIFALN
jgi:hypothetical protein